MPNHYHNLGWLLITLSNYENVCILFFEVSFSVSGNEYNNVIKGEWNGDSNMKVLSFKPIKARFVKLNVFSSVNNFVAATEILVGSKNGFN